MRVTVGDGSGRSVRIDRSELDAVTGAPGLAKVFAACFEPRSAGPICPLCGTTLAQALASGLLGCGLCYATVYPAYRLARARAEAENDSGMG